MASEKLWEFLGVVSGSAFPPLRAIQDEDSRRQPWGLSAVEDHLPILRTKNPMAAAKGFRELYLT
jgi:hypothetical protein